jgi:hypothetical protein
MACYSRKAIFAGGVVAAAGAVLVSDHWRVRDPAADFLGKGSGGGRSPPPQVR